MKTRKRTLAPAVIAGLFLAGFGLVFRAFERRLVTPNLGADAAAFLTWTTLAGAVLTAALLLIGTRTRRYNRRELWKTGAIWTLLSAVAGAIAAGSPASLAADLDLARGGLFGLVLVLCLTAPPLFGLLQRKAL